MAQLDTKGEGGEKRTILYLTALLSLSIYSIFIKHLNVKKSYYSISSKMEKQT
jgi:hypothetical protein